MAGKVTENTVILLGAIRMEFPGEKGEMVAGVQVHYAYLLSETTERQAGSVAEKGWFHGFDKWPKYQALAGQYPCFAEMVPVRRSTNKGVKIVPIDFDILEADPRRSAPVGPVAAVAR
jgi:hypothetical protein